MNIGTRAHQVRPYIYIVLTATLLFVGGISVYAANIAPGTTLDPGCAPGDPGCIVDPVGIGSGVTSSLFGSILFIDSSSQLAQDNTDLFYDSTNKYLGLGSITPGAMLEVSNVANTELIRFTDETNTQNLGIYTGNATPESVISAQVGSLFFGNDGTNALAFIKASGAGTNTGWSAIGGGYTGTTGSVPFVGAGGTLTEDNGNFFFDQGNTRLGIGTATPSATLDVAGNIVPSADDTHDLGTSALRWQDLYLGPSTLHIGSATNESAISYNTTSSALTFQNTTDSTGGFLFMDASAGTPILSIDTTNERVGVGTATPSSKFDSQDTILTSITSAYKSANFTTTIPDGVTQQVTGFFADTNSTNTTSVVEKGGRIELNDTGIVAGGATDITYGLQVFNTRDHNNAGTNPNFYDIGLKTQVDHDTDSDATSYVFGNEVAINVTDTAGGNATAFGTYIDTNGADTNYAIYVDDGQTVLGADWLSSNISGSPNALLELVGDTTPGALLLSRLSDPEGDIGTPVNGMLVYDTDNFVLKAYLNGVWTALDSGTTSPAGADTQVQFNNSGAFGASSDFTFVDSSNALVLGDEGLLQIGINGTTRNAVQLLGSVVGSENVLVGHAGNASMTGTNNLTVGSDSGVSMTLASSNTILGNDAAPLATSGSSNVFIGQGAGPTITTGSSNIFIGTSAGSSAPASISGSIAIGNFAAPTANGQLVIGSTSGTLINDVYIGTGVVDTVNNSVTINASGVNSVDGTAGNLSLAGGKGAGLGEGGEVRVRVAHPGTVSGSTSNSLNTVARFYADNNDSSGSQDLIELRPKVAQSGTAGYTGVKINVTETSTGSGENNLLDVQQGTTSRFRIENTGGIFASSLTSNTGGATYDALCLDTSNNEITINTGGDDCVVSSARFKENILELNVDALEILEEITPKSYTYSGGENEEIGFIAEEVNEIEPRLVFYEKDGITPRGVRYGNFTALLARGIQQIIERLERVETQVEQLEHANSSDNSGELCSGSVCVDEQELGKLLELIDTGDAGDENTGPDETGNVDTSEDTSTEPDMNDTRDQNTDNQNASNLDNGIEAGEGDVVGTGDSSEPDETSGENQDTADEDQSTDEEEAVDNDGDEEATGHDAGEAGADENQGVTDSSESIDQDEPEPAQEASEDPETLEIVL